MPTNREGMTWIEWLAASGCEDMINTYMGPSLKKAWRDGEDPTEWRKGFEEHQPLPVKE